jgi:prolyl-tRNA synthetase
MRASKYFLPILREAPADAELKSHALLLRGGFVKRLSTGVYVFLPLGLRVFVKVANIVREEANRAGCVEILMPTLIPFELLRETGRDKVEVLYKTVDRTGREFALGFTHEEVVTDVARSFVRSYRQMPLTLYQIQTKFRDEPRPRGGLIRGKEFSMFDAYSFDSNDSGADDSYKRMRKMYERAFARMGLNPTVCEAHSGDIGGSDNHEFMVVTDAGEDSVLVNDATGAAANAEMCAIGGEYGNASPSELPAELVSTPNARTVGEVTKLLGVGPEKLVKTLLIGAGDERVAALVRGDRELNIFKLAKELGVDKAEMLEASEVREATGADVGFAGPIGLQGVELIADQEVASMSGFVVGGNVDHKHYINASHGRDFQIARFADIRIAEDGDPAVGGGTLRAVRGIEVGHIFKLGTKYSDSMSAMFDDGSGGTNPIIMGCYGLGIGRSMQSVAEVFHDEAGIIWPISLAPFEAVVIIAGMDDAGQVSAGEAIYRALSTAGIDVLLDDRTDRAGSKFKDADLMGIPLRIVCGRGVSSGNVEIKWRHESAGTEVGLSDTSRIVDMISAERAKYA